jgi:glucose-6-phosphate isomerase
MSILNADKFYLSNEVKDKVELRLKKWDDENIAKRIWQLDPTVWKENPAEQKELADRLGWLDLAISMKNKAKELEAFAEEIKTEFDDVVLLGMGGSSLAPEVFSKTFGSKTGYPRLTILDSTHPLSVRRILESYNLSKTLFVVSSKSGGTIETMSFFYTFFDAVKAINQKPGSQFIALTDPGSGLEKLAKDNGFRKIFSAPPQVGGRFSALTYFGMVPAALIGVDVAAFLAQAEAMTESSSNQSKPSESPAYYLGALLGELALTGVDKLTFFASPKISSFPAWAEQLVAESTGKDDKGILPVADEEFFGTEYYGKDRVIVYLKLEGDDNGKNDASVKQLIDAGFPVIEISLKDKYSLAQEFYRWEAATALCGVVLSINPFNQPNVQLAKSLAGESLAAYKATGSLPKQEPVITEGGAELYSKTDAKNIKDALSNFLAQAKPGDYAAINGFIPMTAENEEVLQKLRSGIVKKYKIATTIGYGPRFLHSTGQLHKGDANKGLFIVISSEPGNDLEVPGQGYSFGTLIKAQVQGDLNALINRSRRTIHIHIKGNVAEELAKLI